jgi:tRNA(adenine34) deaminase
LKETPEAKKSEEYMDLALKEARKALDVDEVPVGAIVVDIPSGRVIARAHNQRELLQDPTAHAEMIAITQAAAHYGSWRLVDAALFVTLEPCVMCSGAIVMARIPKVIYAADDPKAGAHKSAFEVLVHSRSNHRPDVVSGVRAVEAGELLRSFFRKKREEGGAAEKNPRHGGNGRHPGRDSTGREVESGEWERNSGF